MEEYPLDKIENIVKELTRKELEERVIKLTKASEKPSNCFLGDVSKRFEIDFGGNVLAGIEIKGNTLNVFGAMDGWGNGIDSGRIKITEK